MTNRIDSLDIWVVFPFLELQNFSNKMTMLLHAITTNTIQMHALSCGTCIPLFHEQSTDTWAYIIDLKMSCQGSRTKIGTTSPHGI
jgi:hypothetical protein